MKEHNHTTHRKAIAYIRVSSDKQDTQSQKALILEYATKNHLYIDEILEVVVSSTKTQEKRKITELQNKLQHGDILITAEISRLGRGMLEVMNLVLELAQKGVRFVFIRQPELTTFNSPYEKLLLAIWSYNADIERHFISIRTKEGLQAARKSGKKLGRPKGSNQSMYDMEYKQIEYYIREKKLSIRATWLLLDEKGTYAGFHHFCKKKGLVGKK